MANINFKEIIERSKKIRESYHQLERQNHGSEWTIEEDALAFLTDAGLVGRHTMSQQKRWIAKNTDTELEHKLGECIWWLIILADRMNIDAEEAIGFFLTKTEKLLK
ncbi:MazG-like protein [Elizabethkingia sp. HX WHF]|uniref:MazG-like protein n=1 Tax=Elizabethkingia bruuniana TaxID=1756149 RepID=A0A7T7ZWJ7_9FLAO|nr:MULTISPECIES: MazG-like protein [Elizabethkingia]ATL43502.1 MazG-like protein [Elizabethkingia miricola]AQX83936.1 30S ribosomal protein S15 [Elizabethkingia bruuniana]KGO08633.1 30S ribosomal protein S15 [Elizabethkingia miricola]KUY28187.1 30S ribosomal protein S15 [Elizabethkingia bruuniana]MCL1638407.1 MazG-like protein [Elizabethkingia bruuniana]